MILTRFSIRAKLKYRHILQISRVYLKCTTLHITTGHLEVASLLRKQFAIGYFQKKICRKTIYFKNKSRRHDDSGILVILSWCEWGDNGVKSQIVILMFISALFRVWWSAFLHSSWPFLLWQADNKTALHYANLSYGDSPHMGDDQHLRALCPPQTHATHSIKH